MNTTIRFRTKSGSVADMQIGELLEVNGKPFRMDMELEARDRILSLEQRVANIEEAIFSCEEPVSAKQTISLVAPHN